MEGRKRAGLIFLLGLLSAVGPFSIDMYLPGFPVIAADLNTSVDAISYSLSSYFIGICVGQMICGPLLDRYGRMRPLYAGLSLYILASIGCAFSDSIETLIIFRFFQALGGCVGMVAPRAIVRDVFPVNENAKVFSLLVLVIGVSPIIAPTAGSYIIHHFGWHAVFVVLAIMASLVFMAVILFMKESKAPDPGFSLHPKQITKSFLFVLKDPQFYTYALAGGISSSALYAYLSGSPFVFMELYGLSEQEYGWIFAMIAAGLIGSSQLNNLALKKYSSEQIIRVTMLIQLIVGIVLVTGTQADWFGLKGIIACIFLFLCCQGFNFPNASALSMAPFTREAGSASALMGALQMGIGAMASAAVGFLNNGTTLPLTSVMASSVLIGYIILLFGRRKIRIASRRSDVEEQTLDMIENY